MRGPAAYLTALVLTTLMLACLALPGTAAEEPPPEPDQQTKQAIQYYKEGVRAARAGAYEEAIEWFQASLRLKPKMSPPYFSMGYALENLGRLGEAESAYRAVIQMEPENFKGQYNLGNVLESQGRIAEAEAAYREAIRLNPKAARAYNSLAWILTTAQDPAFRRPEEALRYATEAVHLTERMDSSPLDTLAEVNYSLGDCLKAVWIEEEAVSAAPEEGGYKKSLKRFKLCRDAQWASRDGDLSRAKDLWSQVLRIAPKDWRARQELENTP